MKRLTGERTTPGAAIVEWRVVPSQSKGYSGWFLQVGYYKRENGRDHFVCAIEGFFDDLRCAKFVLSRLHEADEILKTA
jgi:hypothetical protein